MGHRVWIGVTLVIAGAAMFGVAVWLLADPQAILNTGFTAVAGESPKVGIFAGIFALILGLVCCFVTVVEEKKTILIVVIIVLLAFTLATFGVALKDRLDIKKLEDLQSAFGNINRQSNTFPGQSGDFGRWKRQVNIRGGDVNIDLLFGKMKKQLVAMAAAAGIAAVLEIIAIILAFTLRPPSTSRNAMQMEKAY